MFRKNSGIEKFQAKEGGEASRFYRNFYLTGPKKLRHGTILCFRKFLVGQNILWIRGGVSRFPVEIFMSHSAENFREGILLFSRKFLGSKRFMGEKGGITFSRLKYFVSQCRKTSYRNPLVFH